MGMYDTIAEEYEALFPVSKVQVNFVKEQVDRMGGRASRILDVGCGTGQLASALARSGLQVEALDLNGEMIKKARQLHGSQPELSFAQLDMRKIKDAFAQGVFDGLLCLGNTLVHLQDEGAISEFLRACKTLLKPSGLFLLQILNYDYILRDKIKELPSIETENLRFSRRYEYPPKQEQISFVTIVEDKKSGFREENREELFPIGTQRLLALLAEAGFNSPETYGSFDGAPLAADSLPLIITTWS